MYKPYVPKLSKFLFTIILAFFASSCSYLFYNTPSKPSPIPIQDDENIDTPQITLESIGTAAESDHQDSSKPTEDFSSDEFEIYPIPAGESLVYYDWVAEDLYLLNGNGPDRDLKVTNRWGIFSKNADSFAFIRNFNTLFIIDVESNSINQVKLNFRCHSLSWSPRADHLAIGCEDNIYIFSLVDNTIERLTSWAQLSVDSFLYPSWSPNSEAIAYFYRDLSSFFPSDEDGIHIIDVSCLVEPSSCREKTKGPIYSCTSSVIFDWSPDGGKLAVYNSLGSIGSILTIDINTSEEIVVMDNIESITGLTWSPDGEWLTYSVMGDIFQISSVGGESILLAEDKGYVVSWIKNEP